MSNPNLGMQALALIEKVEADESLTEEQKAHEIQYIVLGYGAIKAVKQARQGLSYGYKESASLFIAMIEGKYQPPWALLEVIAEYLQGVLDKKPIEIERTKLEMRNSWFMLLAENFREEGKGVRKSVDLAAAELEERGFDVGQLDKNGHYASMYGLYKRLKKK